MEKEETEIGGQKSEVGTVAGAALKLSEAKDKADFRKLLALIIILGGGAYLWMKAEAAQVIAYVFGIMSTAIGYFFNTTQSSQDKDKRMAELNKKEVI